MNVYYAGGATHNDHHKEINIGGDVTAEALQQIMADFLMMKMLNLLMQNRWMIQRNALLLLILTPRLSLLLPLQVELQMRSFWIRMVKKI